ncbi:MAG TPA: hypothetical protein VF066_10590 [Thermoleophilaceae bacterium]
MSLAPALAGVAGSVALYVVAAMVDLFREPGWAWRWLVAIAAFGLVFIPLGVHWWLLAALATLHAGSWTRAERTEAKAWSRQLQEEHPDWPRPKKRRVLDNLRWGARFVMWVAFIAAPLFLAAAIVGLF